MKKLVAILTVLSMLALLCVPAAASPKAEEPRAGVNAIPPEIPASQQEWDVLRITNAERMNEGLAPLTMISPLQTATDIRANEIVESFSHTRPDGSSCFSVILEVGLSYSTVGENIAAGYASPAAVMDGWMNSSGHRANILNSGYRHLGVGYTYSQNSDYGSYWVQLFYTGWDCAYSSFEILGMPDTGTSVDALGLTGRFVCAEGYCYLPLTSAMCTGDTTANGVRTLTFSCFGLTASVSAGAPAGMPGDVNGDGLVNANDALAVLRFSLGLVTEIDPAADVTGDGIVNANDALMILRAALGLIEL